MKFIPPALLIGVIALGFAISRTARADEQFFGFARGAETLPKGHAEVYQFVTLRTGKDAGTYYGSDFCAGDTITDITSGFNF